MAFVDHFSEARRLIYYSIGGSICSLFCLLSSVDSAHKPYFVFQLLSLPRSLSGPSRSLASFSHRLHLHLGSLSSLLSLPPNPCSSDVARPRFSLNTSKMAGLPIGQWRDPLSVSLLLCACTSSSEQNGRLRCQAPQRGRFG